MMLARTRQAARRFPNSDAGATAIEYGLIAALIAVAIIVALFNYSNQTRNLYGYISNSVTNATNSGN
jgi:pilus assembly protein Flp/PilA